MNREKYKSVRISKEAYTKIKKILHKKELEKNIDIWRTILYIWNKR